MTDEQRLSSEDRRITAMAFEHPVHHITLTVTNLRRSTTWYCDVLQGQLLVERVGEGFRRSLIRLPCGLVIGLTQHVNTQADDRFDPRRVGLDHLSLAVPTAEDVNAWAAKWDDHGIDHDPVVAAASGTLVVCYDPDGIPVEIYSPTT
jgi:catechol 2,3-dioxygenase-like lactoylglutathione lyase family enzyme